jgi:hypothetical protein
METEGFSMAKFPKEGEEGIIKMVKDQNLN